MTEIVRRTRRALAVVGAHYGDEGKGLVVDRLVRDLAEPWVVRFNGGAQAGHTVTLPDGRRHVFSHFGAGTLAGAPTFLSRFFVSNPHLFIREWTELEALRIAPRVVVDPGSPLTTPYEVLINRAVERARGMQRHGSCGVGFGETLEREEQGVSLTVGDLDAPRTLRSRLDRLRLHHVPRRLAQLGVAIDPALAADLADPTPVAHFIAAARAFRERIEVAGPAVCAEGSIVFEGAQGLLLDQTLGAFPHVTRSHTGLPNIVALAAEMRVEEVEVFYAMRTYLTRHGAGPLDHELDAPPYTGIVDPTNRPNPFQGTLRFAAANPALSIETIVRDRVRVASGSVGIVPALAVTCLDQLDGPVVCYDAAGRRALEPDDFVAEIAGAIGARRVLLSRGPSARTASFRSCAYSAFRASAAPSASARSLP